MEGRKMGRPKAKNPRNKQISFPVTEAELKRAQEIANKNELTYVEIFLKGLEHWSDK